MDRALQETDVDTLAARVREALGAVYASPLVYEQVDGTVAVLGGKPLLLAREAVGEALSARIVEISVTSDRTYGAPAEGLRLWRQHGQAGAAGELVTELEAGDPPFHVVVEDDEWQLLRLADGSQGWIEPGTPIAEFEAPAPRPDTVDREAFIAALLAFEDAPYVWGGTTAAGVDCSGLVQRAAWRAGGPWLPRHSRALLRAGARVAPSAVARGDVLVLQRDPRTVGAERAAQLQARAEEEQRTGTVPAHGPAVHPMHVAVALSSEETLHASRDSMRVVREPLDSLLERYRALGVRRICSGAGA